MLRMERSSSHIENIYALKHDNLALCAYQKRPPNSPRLGDVGGGWKPEKVRTVEKYCLGKKRKSGGGHIIN